MSSLIVDSRDQRFVLHEMLEVESICKGRYEGFSRDTIDMILAEAGSDVGALTTRAARQPDGTFLIQGTKIFISCGDHDFASNMVHPVLARIEGDPEGTKGISIFLVPKYRVNNNGTPGARNDLEVTKIEEKMGLHGSATCVINFGDKGGCVGELLGQEREGMKIMFMMMNGARMSVSAQGLSGASFSYLQALGYARERIQGTDLLAKGSGSVPIVSHPDVRRMLLWMKSHVEAMRALIYFSGICRDRGEISADPKGKAKWTSLLEVLTPVCKAYCSDMAFRICETAVQIYGGYGYCSEYPVEQVLRDEKIGSIYEGSNGIQALDLVGRKLGMKGGAYFMELITEMNKVLGRYKECCPDIVEDVYGAVEALVSTVWHFGQCGKEGKFTIPIVNAYPFLMMMGKAVSAWLLFWQAGIATEKLAAMGVDFSNRKALKPRCREDGEVAFYAGKIAGAAYFIRKMLPEVEAAAKAIRREDMSVLEIAEESFAS